MQADHLRYASFCARGYWYSPDLSVYLIVQHDDPRTGEQIVAVKDVERADPDVSAFAVPARYRIVDENPAP
jgi:hypothetical protein